MSTRRDAEVPQQKEARPRRLRAGVLSSLLGTTVEWDDTRPAVPVAAGSRD